MNDFLNKILALLLLFLLWPLFLLITILIRLSSKGNAIYWSKRIGINSTIFLMPKFRTMYTDTPAVATHLLKDSSRYITPIGSILRKTSLDELPQLWSILFGHMNFVGPRPALYNQDDLIMLRKKLGVDTVKPGVTGLAQISGRDELDIPIKVQFDKEYVEKRSFYFDLKIIIFTILKVIKSEGVKH